MTSPRRTARTRRPQAPENTAVAYLRVSTDEQADSGAGLAAQRTAIQQTAEARGWTVIAWHSDEGLSGTLAAAERPGLAAALEAVQTGQAATLIAAKSDRLARSVHTLSGLMVQADEQGWNLTAADGTVDTSTAAGRFQTHIMAGVAELERSLISDRTRAALAERRAAGVRLGRPSSLPREIVARIVAERDAGASLRAIGQGLEADAVPTAQGGARWYPATVRAVLAGQDAAAIRAEQVTA